MARRKRRATSKPGVPVPKPSKADLRLAKAIGDVVVPQFELLRHEMGGLRTELRHEMGELRTELRQEMGQLRTELRTEMTELRTEMHSGFASIRDEVHELREGVVGIGRIMKLEARVDALEKQPR